MLFYWQVFEDTAEQAEAWLASKEAFLTNEDVGVSSMCKSRGRGRGSDPPPLKNHQNIGFLSNTDPEPLKNHKTAKLAFNNVPSLARQQNAI